MVDEINAGIQKNLGLYRGGDNTKIDSIVEYREISVFLKENGNSIAASQRKELESQLENYRVQSSNGGYRQNLEYDESKEYANKRFQIGNSGFICEVWVHPKSDGSGVVKLFSITNPLNGEVLNLNNLCKKYNDENSLTVSEKMLLDYIKEEYGCGFEEYAGFYNFNGVDNVVFSPKASKSKKTNGSKDSSLSSGVSGNGTLEGTSASGGLNGVGKLLPLSEIETNEQNQQYAEAFNILLSRYNEALSALKGQLNDNGFFNALAEGVFKTWAPSSGDASRALEELNKILAQLQQDLKYNDFENFKKDFAENFGTEFNSGAITAYKNDCDNFTLVSEQYTALELFKNTKKSVNDKLTSSNVINKEAHKDSECEQLLNEMVTLFGGDKQKVMKALMLEADGLCKENPSQYALLQMDWNSFGPDLKWLLMNRLYNRDRAEINKLGQNLETYYKSAAGSIYGTSDFDRIKEKHQQLYEQAFGIKNSACKIVEDYCEMSQIGGGIAKGVVMGAVLLTVGVASGGALSVVTVPLSTYATEMATAAIDEGTKTKALNILKNQGASAFMDYMYNEVPWGQIHGQAMTDGAVSVIFMGQACTISNICKVGGAAMGLGERGVLGLTMGTQMAGDVALGGAVEYAATGEMTVHGVVFTVLMDVVGNAIHIKDYHRKRSASEADNSLGFNQKEPAKLSESAQSHSAILDFAYDANSLNYVSTRIKNDALLSPAEKAYLQSKVKTKAATIKSNEAKVNELSKRLENATTQDLDNILLEIEHSDFSGTQKKKLRNEMKKRIDELVQDGSINPSESDLYRFYYMDDIVAGGFDVTRVFQEKEIALINKIMTKNGIDPRVMNDIVLEMKKGVFPSKDMLESIALKWEIKRVIDLKDTIDQVFKQLAIETGNKNYGALRAAFRTSVSRQGDLFIEVKEGVEAFKQSRNLGSTKQSASIVEQNNSIQNTEETPVKQKPELAPKQESHAKIPSEQQRLIEKYPELEDLPFRDESSLVELGKAMEEYEQYLKNNVIDYTNFDSTDLYQRLSNIRHDSDVDIAFDAMKKKYHSDIIAEENRIAELRTKYGLDDEQIQTSDKIIEQLKIKEANGETFTSEDIDFMIEDAQGYNTVRNQRVKNRILDEMN